MTTVEFCRLKLFDAAVVVELRGDTAGAAEGLRCVVRPEARRPEAGGSGGTELDVSSWELAAVAVPLDLEEPSDALRECVCDFTMGVPTAAVGAPLLRRAEKG